MESWRSTSNGGPQRSRPRRRPKAASVSARLQPDFDPKVSLLNSTTSDQKSKNHEELDPNTMEFDALVEFLHPSFILDYLLKILQYLEGDQKEMCFPNIAPYKEAFLVNLARDNRHLECSVFNEACKAIAKHISRAIEANKNVFKWIHMYESGRVARNVLLYKKVYLNEASSTISPAQEHKTSCSTLNPCAHSLSSSLEDLNTKDRQAIPTTFKIQTLNATLKFIKDDNRLTLEYPEMPLHQAEYVYSLICSRNIDVGYGYKSLHSSLFQAMNELREQYEFEVMFADSNRVTTRTILRKIPKATSLQKSNNVTQSNEGTSSPHQLNSSIVSNDSENSRLAKKQKSKQEIIELVSESWMKNSLRRFVEFVEDETMASLEFKDVSYPGSRFIESALSIARSNEQHKFLKGECATMLRNIVKGCKQDWWKLRIDVGKMNKRTGTRIITYYKIPTDKKPPACNQRCVNGMKITITNSEKMAVDKPKSPEKAANSKTVTNLPANGSSRRAVSRERSLPEKACGAKTVNNPSANASSRRAVSRERRPGKQLSGIAFQSAGAQVVDPSDDVTKAKPEPEKRPATDRKRRLLEAMSTPMESDLAERMMRRMGWEGGALGARGEGITEPIMPALHLSPGAGLGHVKTANKSTAEFRTTLLQNLLSFLKSQDQEATLTYTQPMTKREARFMGPTLMTLNQRKLVGLHRAEEMEVVKKVLEVLVSDQQLVLSCHVSDDKKAIKLTKHYGQTITARPSRKKKKRSKFDPTQHDTTKQETLDHLANINATFELEKSCETAKAAKALAYRIMFLEKIREFLKTRDAEKEFLFDFVLNIKQRNYIQGVVIDINRRDMKCKHNSDIENEIYKEIKKVAGDCYMSVIFSGQKFILQKKYYQRRFTNSALGLPPPVSTDVKNTIIYDNKKDIPKEEDYIDEDITKEEDYIDEDITKEEDYIDEDITKEEDYIDEDISIIRDKTEIIVISDSDDETNVETDRKIDIDNKDDTCQNSDETDCDDTAKDLDMSSESVLLDLLEENVANCNNGMSLDSTFDEKFVDLENAILQADVAVLDDYVIEKDKEPKESFYELKDCINNLAQVKEEFPDDSSQINVDLEVNNNYNIIKDRNDGDVKQDMETEPLEVNDDSYKDCDSSPSSKRYRSDSENSESAAKKYKLEPIKTVLITPDVTPKEIISVDLIKKVQKVISNHIDNSIFLPLLECCGVREGALVYNCHNDKTLSWLKNVLDNECVTLQVVECYSEVKLHDVIIRINSYIDVNVSKFLTTLELYNSGLDTSEWVVTDEQTHEDCVVIAVTMDDGSYKFICENNYSLFAGIDKVQFSVVWE